MTYIDFINAFWLLDEEWQFTPVETRLYFLLLKTANRLGWSDSIVRSDTRIAIETGVSLNTMKKARNRLLQAELIAFKSGGKGKNDKSRYQILTPKLTPKLTPILTPNLTPNIYKVRALDIDIDNTLSHNARDARASEFSRVDNELKEKMLEDTAWFRFLPENVYRQTKVFLDEETLLSMLDDFIVKLRADGEQVKSLEDAKKHFSNWLLIKVKEANNGYNKGNTTTKQEANDYALQLLMQHKRELENGMDDPMEKPF